MLGTEGREEVGVSVDADRTIPIGHQEGPRQAARAPVLRGLDSKNQIHAVRCQTAQ